MMKEPKPGEQSPEKRGEISPGDKELLDRSFENYFLDNDVVNSLMAVALSARSGQFEAIQTYEEYVREVADRRTGEGEADAYYNYVMERSDSKKVAEYNEMIKAFNDDLENIKRAKDNQKVQTFVQKAVAFLTIKRKSEER